MSLAVYMDVHVPAAVTEGLRRKLLDVRTAQADAAGRLSDEELLARATAVGCVLLTQDADFLEITARWQQHGIPFSGVLFAPQGTPIGRMIEDSELCLTGMTADEFRNRLVHLPLRQPLDAAMVDDPTVGMREYTPQMVARFTINAVPALAVLERGKPTDRDGAPVPVWDSIHAIPGGEPATAAGPAEAIVPLTYDRREAARRLRKPQPKS